MIYMFQKYSVGLKRFYFFLSSEIDCYCAGAKLSIQNGYNRPEIVEHEKSFFRLFGYSSSYCREDPY